MAGLTSACGVAVLRAPDVLVRWAAGGAPAEGQTTSGDRHLVRQLPGVVVIGLVDALGHGIDAAGVAGAAAAAIHDSDAPSVAGRARDCHQALGGTRGAVAALASVDAGGTLTWTGVGNVEAVVLRFDQGRLAVAAALRQSPGVLGMRLPDLTEARVSLWPGDLLLLATDGVDPAFDRDPRPGDDPEAVVRRIVPRRLRRHDDGLVVAARFETPDGPE